MKNKFILATLALTLALTFIYSCKKEDEEDHQKPVIMILKPSMNDTFSLTTSDSIPIQFNTSDNDELHEVTVNVKNAGGTSVFTKSLDVDEKSLAFSHFFKPGSLSASSMFTLTVEVSDHHLNTDLKTVIFYVRP